MGGEDSSEGVGSRSMEILVVALGFLVVQVVVGLIVWRRLEAAGLRQATGPISAVSTPTTPTPPPTPPPTPASASNPDPLPLDPLLTLLQSFHDAHLANLADITKAHSKTIASVIKAMQGPQDTIPQGVTVNGETVDHGDLPWEVWQDTYPSDLLGADPTDSLIQDPPGDVRAVGVPRGFDPLKSKLGGPFASHPPTPPLPFQEMDDPPLPPSASSVPFQPVPFTTSTPTSSTSTSPPTSSPSPSAPVPPTPSL